MMVHTQLIHVTEELLRCTEREAEARQCSLEAVVLMALEEWLAVQGWRRREKSDASGI
jgi:hypothetical protein